MMVKLDRPCPRLWGVGDWPQRQPGGEIEVLEVEVFYNIDKPMERYVRFPGGPLTALQDNSAPAEQTIKLAPVKGRRLSRPKSSAFPDPLPEPPPRPV